VAIEKDGRSTPVWDIYHEELEVEADRLGRRRRILDLGGGAGMFAFDGIEMEQQVITLDLDRSVWNPILEVLERAEKIKKESSELARWRGVMGRCGNGDMRNLPFVDESIDLILSRYAFPQASEKRADMEMVLLEMVRVLVPGGEARCFPFFTERWSVELQEMVVRSLECLKKIENIWVEVKEKTITHPWGQGERTWLLVIRKMPKKTKWIPAHLYP